MRSIRLLLKLSAIAASSRSTRIFYDRVSPFYELVFTDHLRHIQTMVTALGEQFPRRRQIEILDMACGTGALSRRLDAQGFCVTGLDFSFQSLCHLNQTGKTIRSVQADAAALPFRARSFDAVTCMGAWRHFPDPQRVLDEVCRVLRPSGLFLVGYFPPKLAGLVSVPSGLLGKASMFLYGQLARLLKYEDRTDQELEREIVQMIQLAFTRHHLIQSDGVEYLIFAESPR